MNLNDLEKQVQELKKINPSSFTSEQFQEFIEKIQHLINEGETMFIKEFESQLKEGTIEDDLDYYNDEFDLELDNEIKYYDEDDNT
jgi:hypothetical protein